jgi:hypothetical protein
MIGTTMLLKVNQEYVKKPFLHLCCGIDGHAINKGTHGHLYQCNGCLETWRGSDPQDKKTGVRERHMRECFIKEPKPPKLEVVPEQKPKSKLETIPDLKYTEVMAIISERSKQGKYTAVLVDETKLRGHRWSCKVPTSD